MNFFTFDANGQKQGPVNIQQLQSLVAQGIITTTTPLETDTGHKGTAGQIPGLFTAAHPNFAQPVQAAATNLFCTNCGNPVPDQVTICTSCGAILTPPKSRVVAAIFAIIFGCCGVHKFYMGSSGWGMVFFLFNICTCCVGGILTGICGIAEGLVYLGMSDEEFAAKYPPETEAPFRW
ncbi:MAG: NINE protein [Thermoguttaceae bacterium]